MQWGLCHKKSKTCVKCTEQAPSSVWQIRRGNRRVAPQRPEEAGQVKQRQGGREGGGVCVCVLRAHTCTRMHSFFSIQTIKIFFLLLNRSSREVIKELKHECVMAMGSSGRKPNWRLEDQCRGSFSASLWQEPSAHCNLPVKPCGLWRHSTKGSLCFAGIPNKFHLTEDLTSLVS